MTFEISDKDLAGRIGRLRTRRGIIETPYLFPVINPFDRTITVKDIEKLGFNAFITNILHVRRAMQEYGVIDVHYTQRSLIKQYYGLALFKEHHTST
ncbi:MAG: hypothetical protein QXS67_00170 [Candidatus Nezhaarchaeales archaeon]